jgi:YebC/PmpR family DNA-binding regulatory protein
VYEQVSYEGYAPGGVAVIVQALTDNRNRTSAEIKNLFSRNGGSFAEPGAVSWQFERKGIVNVDKSVDEDEIMLAAAEAGADDVEDGGDAWQVTTPPTDLHAVRSAIEDAGYTVSSSDLTMIPTTAVQLSVESQARTMLRLMDALEEHDDVEAVYANFDIPDSILEAVTA